jgi:hypothetical protein
VLPYQAGMLGQACQFLGDMPVEAFGMYRMFGSTSHGRRLCIPSHPTWRSLNHVNVNRD